MSRRQLFNCRLTSARRTGSERQSPFSSRPFVAAAAPRISTSTPGEAPPFQAHSFTRTIQRVPDEPGEGAEVAAKGMLVNFRTAALSTGAATVHHEVSWESSTGRLADLRHIETREHISWNAAPPEFGPPGAYAAAGDHYGLGTNTASGGSTADDHSIIPPEFNFALEEDGASPTWKMNQQYEYRSDGGDWQPILGADYQITRWFERSGTTLIAYAAKRGIHEPVMHRAMVSLEWFT